MWTYIKKCIVVACLSRSIEGYVKISAENIWFSPLVSQQLT